MTGFKDVNNIKVAKHSSLWWAVLKAVIKVRGHTQRELYAVLDYQCDCKK
jgi:hypothetical protein